MSKSIILSVIVIILVTVGIFFFLTNGQNNQTTVNSNNIVQISQTSVNTNNNTQDPQDVVPGLYPDPIKNNSAVQGFKIASLMVENNTDAAGNPVSDHLQLTLKNLTNKDLSNFEVYYTIMDTVSNKKEGYYKKLGSYVLKAGATQIINFDNKQGIGHFTVNTRSLYFTSSNKLSFNVFVSTLGYKVETASVEKAAGGAETKD
ncbi:hypothetical protein M1271_02055 [Patescibacteria group bacterium]|nr:hypothetical protein [Patescibacteria group bacterium]MCL5798324.1 hypothetical protein [Patescibacteria group bacterium]